MDSFDNVVRKRFSSLFGKSSWLRKRLAKPRARKWLRGLKKRSGNSLEKLSGPFRAFGTAFVGLGTSFKQLRGKLASPFKKLPGILQSVIISNFETRAPSTKAGTYRKNETLDRAQLTTWFTAGMETAFCSGFKL
ncbi:hypothetical protein BKA67DRAFT_532557 [Truncatella angustata]|uniref:Uncharacterized protein n=1 Tax=Truncatella angustata TaxID=152316 RepID=A0A9P8US42_9PEZI|nr:uncharacterized protein BKA67DRAFT_532557 [Truncatella angustata]KAH6657344.1 hypothetical protein BKA67DRAFT_532557 [Truncatella angustata]